MKDKDFVGMVLENGWSCDMQPMTGSLEWTHPDYEDLSIYATPDYNEDGVVPFDYSIDGDYFHVLDLTIPDELSEVDKILWYHTMLLGVIAVATNHQLNLVDKK
ncbi:MAG: hypothetical protein OQK82_08360 [Candidatus Pacearchaeota archaeon]|nr:hypothetical protein [Candidatus Pacearchaeota archaeon]